MTELFRSLESAQTAAVVAVASGLRGFLRGLRALPAAIELCARAKADPSVAAKVMARISDVGALQVDNRFENPHDVAVAAYLYVLASASPALYESAARSALLIPNCWWSNQIARLPLGNVAVSSESQLSADSEAVFIVESPATSYALEIIASGTLGNSGAVWRGVMGSGLSANSESGVSIISTAANAQLALAA